MSKLFGKFKPIDYAVMIIVAAVIVGGVALFLLNRGGKTEGAATAATKTTIQFDLEVVDIERPVVDAYKKTVGLKGTYGVSNVDACTITRVIDMPQQRITPDLNTGEFVTSDVPDRYKVVITAEAEVNESDYEFKGDYDLICGGKQLQLHTKGMAALGYVTDIKVLPKKK